MREFDLIRRITKANPSLPNAVLIPPGDDMAMLRCEEGRLLAAVDQVIDQVHFDLGRHPVELIGRKAVTRNLSDVAAMAALPVVTLCAANLPRTMPADQAERLLVAVAQTASSFGCPLIGGDTATHDGPLALSVTILARPGGIEPVRRSGSAVGDAIYVTGELGGSLYSDPPHHLTFEPRLELARGLAADPTTRPNAMVDLSDGLGRDLDHLLNGLGALIDTSDLPVSAAARQAERKDGHPAWLHAMSDGEDYELLFTAPPEHNYPPEIDGVRITRVGTVIAEPGAITVIDGGEQVSIDGLGWEHQG
ncbi:MAG: thiamine-phosphate kinase [Planctomycetota bacterium]